MLCEEYERETNKSIPYRLEIFPEETGIYDPSWKRYNQAFHDILRNARREITNAIQNPEQGIDCVAAEITSVALENAADVAIIERNESKNPTELIWEESQIPKDIKVIMRSMDVKNQFICFIKRSVKN